MTDEAPDTITSGGDTGWSSTAAGREAAAARGGRLTALTTAVALVFTGGVATAVWRSAGQGHNAEQLIPSTAFAVGTVDLSMPDGQGDALQTLANRFPHSPTHSGTGDAVDRLLRAAFGSSDTHVNYDRDIKPWLGDHIALAGWLDSSGKPRVEGVVQSTDDTAARAGLTKLFHGHAAVRFTDGYAVIADKDTYAAQAIAAAHNSSIADRSTYTGDVDALPGSPFATGWIDADGVRKALTAALGPHAGGMLPGMSPFGPFGLFGPGLMGAVPGSLGPGMAMGGMAGHGRGQQLAGRMSVGVQVADDYIEIDSRATGQPIGQQTDSSLLTGLPSSTIAGVALANPSQIVDGATRALGAVMQFQAFAAGPQESFGATGCVASAAPPPLSAIPPTVAHRKRILRELRRVMRRHGPGRCFKVRGAPPLPPMPSMQPLHRQPSPLAQIRKQTGLDLPQDADTVLGSSLVASYGGLELNGVPKVALRTHPDDLSAATVIARRLQGRVAKTAGFGMAVDTQGADLLLATTSDYLSAVEGGSGLGDQSQVKTALGDVPAQVGVAGYVDLSKILPLLASHLPADLLHVKAVGFWTAADGSAAVSQTRIVIG